MKNEIYEGNLIIRNAEDARKYKGLTKVTGYLYIYSSAKLDAPKLETDGYGKFKVYDNIGCVVLSSNKHKPPAVFVGPDDHDDNWNGLERRKARPVVPVSLEKCAEALRIHERDIGYDNDHGPREAAKAVLDAAGVTYVE